MADAAAAAPFRAPPRAPFLLGARGAPLEAPENTRASFATALALGLDGVAADVRASRGGELVVHADARLERTTDGRGFVGETPWTTLAGLDAGASFHARFRGERLLLVEELLEFVGQAPPGATLLLDVHGACDLARLGDLVRELAPRASVRVVAGTREDVLAARDAGLAAAVRAGELDERLRERVQADGVSSLIAPLEAWRAPSADQDWPVERWALDVDGSEELLIAHRLGLHAVSTREPRRALAARALHALAPGCAAWPVACDPLEVAPDPASLLVGGWSGTWDVAARVTNPFAFPIRVRAGLAVRRGAFDAAGLPRAFELAPGVSEPLAFRLTGGARRPGGDPLLVARCTWPRGPGRAAGELDVDAPLVRVRTAVADALPRRIELVVEAPRERPATLVLRRRARHLVVALESRGPLVDPEVVVRLAGRTFRGRRGVRVPLPADFDARSTGIPFTCGLEAWDRGERATRVWAGGLGDEPDAGSPGVLLPRSRA